MTDTNPSLAEVVQTAGGQVALPQDQYTQAGNQGGVTAQRRTSPSIDAHPVVQAVVDKVYADPAVAPKDAAGVAARIIAAVIPLVQPVEVALGVPPRTQMALSIGIDALEALVGLFFPHPAAV